MKTSPLALLLSSSLAGTLAAQTASSGRLDGTVSGPPRAIRGATIEVTRIRPEPIVMMATGVDDRGRFRFDSLPPGEYALHVGSPLLDSLQLSAPDRAVTIAVAGRARADIALPAAPALREAVCPGLALGKGRGVITGRAIDADTDQPLVGATVVVSWNELAVDRTTLTSIREERLGTAATGDRGEYRLCGVPTGTSLSLQLQRGDDASAEVKLAVSEEDGAVVRDLSLSARAEPALVGAVPIDRASTRDAPDTAMGDALTGTSSLAGTVRGVGGQPLPDTELRVVGASAVAVSDTMGRFSLSALPAGTQMLAARRIGYEVLEIPVELRAGRLSRRDVQLTRVVSLDSMRVVAIRSRYSQFEFNRRANPFGYFLGPEELERRKAAETSELLTGIPGLVVSGHGREAFARSVHGRGGARACSSMRVLVDGRAQGVDLNDVPPSMIGAIEIYTQGAFAPSEYSIRGSCGVIAIWTKRSDPPPSK